MTADSIPLVFVSLTADATVDALTGSVNSILIMGDWFTPYIVLSNGTELIKIFFTATCFGAGGASDVSSFLQEKRKMTPDISQIIFFKFWFTTDHLFYHICVYRMRQCHCFRCLSIYP